MNENVIGNKNWATLAVAVLVAISASASFARPWQQLNGSAAHNGTWQGLSDLMKIDTAWIFCPMGQSGTNITALNPQTQPCLSADGGMIFVCGNLSEGQQAKLIALDAYTGELVWAKTVYSYVDFDSASSPVYDSGYVYWIGSNATEAAYVYKINAMNGSSESEAGGWETTIDGAAIVNCTPLVVNDMVYFSTYPTTFGANDAVHYALDADDGSTVWMDNLRGGPGTAAMGYFVGSDAVCQITYEGGVNNVTSFDAGTGAVNWISDWELTNPVYQSGISVYGSTYGFVVQDYSFSGNGKIYNVNPNNGALNWSAETLKSGAGCPVIDNSGMVVVCSDFNGSGNTQAFDKDGNLAWTCEQAGGWKGSPSMSWNDATVFIGDQSDDLLYVLDRTDGTIVAVLGGSGPVAFGNQFLYSIGVDGWLYAYTTGGLFAANDVITTAYGEFTDSKKKPKIAVQTVKQKAKTLYNDADQLVFESSSLPALTDTSLKGNLMVDGQETDEYVWVMGPTVTSVAPFSGSVGDAVSLTGYFMTSKRPKIFVGDANDPKALAACKVVKHYMYPESGKTMLQFEISNKAESGTVDLVIEVDKSLFVFPGFQVK